MLNVSNHCALERNRTYHLVSVNKHLLARVPSSTFVPRLADTMMGRLPGLTDHSVLPHIGISASLGISIENF